MCLLAVRNLEKRFVIHALGRQIPAFSGLNFQLESGQFLKIGGPNGSGKSTLLRCLYRTCRPTSGSALFQSSHGLVDLARAADVDIALLRRDEIGFVTQFLRPRPRVRAIDLVAEPLLGRGIDVDSARESARDLLRAFGLKPGLHEAYPSTFSGGEQQKINLARALITPKRLLLLDEPTASLDQGAREALVARLSRLKVGGTAMIAVFHHEEDAAGLVDDVLNLNTTAAAEISGA